MVTDTNIYIKVFMLNVVINKAFQLFAFRFAPDSARSGNSDRSLKGAAFFTLFIFYIWSLLYSERFVIIFSPFYQKQSEPFGLCDPLLFKLKMKWRVMVTVMCTSGDWILLVAIHLSDQRSSFDKDSYTPVLRRDKNKL